VSTLSRSTEDSRRAFVLKNYAVLRTRVDELPDTLAGIILNPPMGANWRTRWEYLEACDRDMQALVERAMVTSGGVITESPAWAGNVGLISGVMSAEEKLSVLCVRFIHSPAEAVDKPAARKYLFTAFAECEAAWVRAAGFSDKKGDDQ
jgi:hypothetical protein